MVYSIKKIGWGVLAVVLILVLVGGVFVYTNQLPDNWQDYPKKKIYVPHGASLQRISDVLVENGLLENRQFFILFAKLTGKDTSMPSGLFEVPRALSTWQLLNYLQNPIVARIKVTFPEGLISWQMAGILRRKLAIDSLKFVRLVNNKEFAYRLVGERTSLEGYLLPETYYFDWKTPEPDIIRHMVSKCMEIFKPDSIQQRMVQMERSRREILALASIVEGEAVVDDEREYVASLYHNRLHRGWRLQADPTIQFILPGPPRRLYKKDLEIESPYNTYKHRGLPPGPINNPGKRSIIATLYPADTPYLYMVAAGNGRHRFSTTLEEHEYWHRRFNQIRRQVQMEKRRRKQSTDR